MQTGFIGLGNLGTPLVKNLIEKDRKLHLFNRTAEKMKAFEGKATLHSNVASIAKECDVIISILSDDAAVKSLCYLDEGLLANLKAGSTHICLSTIAASTAVELEAAHKAKGIEYVTATIIGRPEAAIARAITVCYSGTSEKKDYLLELLTDLGGKNFFEYGDEAKNAAVIKICNNFLIIAAIEAMGEAMNLVEKAGVDTTRFYEMITSTLFSAPIYKTYGKIIIDKSYDKAGFTSQLGLKDTKLALALADEVSATLPFADVAKNHFIVNHNRGRNQQDWTSIVKVIEEENGKI